MSAVKTLGEKKRAFLWYFNLFHSFPVDVFWKAKLSFNEL